MTHQQEMTSSPRAERLFQNKRQSEDVRRPDVVVPSSVATEEDEIKQSPVSIFVRTCHGHNVSLNLNLNPSLNTEDAEPRKKWMSFSD